MKVPFFVPWINKQDKDAINKALTQRWLTNGPLSQKFEEKFQKFLKLKYSLTTSSATHALHLSLRSIGIKQGDEVIVPTFTFTATADVVSYCNAKPILADTDPETFNISAKSIRKKISKKTKAIILVHYGGQACNIKEIAELAKRSNLSIIEDCAHALGSKYQNRFCGSFGAAGCFSFYPTKIITTGEGGMLTTNDKEIFNKSKSLRSHSMTKLPIQRESEADWKYDVVDLGFNYRLDEIRSALGLSQLARINLINKYRMNIAKKYDEGLGKINGITIPKKLPDRNHIFHLYTIKIHKNFHLSRDEVFQKLHKAGIGTSVQYLPLHLMTCNKRKYNYNDFPNANKIKDEILSLPIFPKMTNNQIQYVVNTLKKI